MAKKVGAEKKREARNLTEAVGAVLTDLRAKNGWSVRELSHRINYVHNTILNVEMGRKSPTIRTVEVFARAYGVKVSDLMRAAERRIKR
jgi:ribosome-binding protein aMBF1 (putative translation factor)